MAKRANWEPGVGLTRVDDEPHRAASGSVREGVQVVSEAGGAVYPVWDRLQSAGYGLDQVPQAFVLRMVMEKRTSIRRQRHPTAWV